ncbi:MAG: alpha/beta hydrolase [Chitinophagales bacterium]|nr:MAG: alpha/beta hydrolase [Chitinophagales bacterium]
MTKETIGIALQKKENIFIPGKHGKPIVADITWPVSSAPLPVVIFCHGFKGFKDWGYFNLAAEAFARSGIMFVKFNFSHNGTSPENPLEFVDLDAFANNNLSIELDDLGRVIDYVEQAHNLKPAPADTSRIFLAGHSRGGSVAILKAAEDGRIKKLVTWSAVSDFEKNWSPDLVEHWKTTGVLYVPNVRTGQQMPLHYQLYTDYITHRSRLRVLSAAAKIHIPFLIIHGTQDETVPFQDAEELHKACPTAKLLPIEGADHVFGGKHPWKSDTLPAPARQVILASADFLNAPC